MALDYDPAIIGRVFEETDPVAVSEKEINDFCTAIGETNPWYTDAEAARKGPYSGLIAPPLFVLTFRNGRHFFQNIPAFGKGGFDAGRDVEFVNPVRPGDQIKLVSHVKEIYEKTGRSGAMYFVTIRSTVHNQNNEVVAHIDHRFMGRL